jgi:hypothetical protein
MLLTPPKQARGGRAVRTLHGVDDRKTKGEAKKEAGPLTYEGDLGAGGTMLGSAPWPIL